jgi:hypothetical protein
MFRQITSLTRALGITVATATPGLLPPPNRRSQGLCRRRHHRMLKVLGNAKLSLADGVRWCRSGRPRSRRSSYYNKKLSCPFTAEKVSARIPTQCTGRSSAAARAVTPVA